MFYESFGSIKFKEKKNLQNHGKTTLIYYYQATGK